MLKRLTLLTTTAMLFALPSFAQNSVESRVDRIEREMQTLSRAIYKGDVPPPSISAPVDAQANAATEMRLNQIEDQLRRLTGMIEEQGYKLRKLESDSNRSRVDAKPIEPEVRAQKPVDLSASGSQQPMENSLGTISGNADTSSPAGLYDQAFAYMQKKDYETAQSTFDDFLSQYPDHSLAENAKYWLGETYYAREDYDAASRAFARAFQDHPDGQKAPDVLLKLAMSLKGQDMSEEACLTLTELKKRFPSAPPSVLTKADDERASYGCE